MFIPRIWLLAAGALEAPAKLVPSSLVRGMSARMSLVPQVAIQEDLGATPRPLERRPGELLAASTSPGSTARRGARSAGRSGGSQGDFTSVEERREERREAIVPLGRCESQEETDTRAAEADSSSGQHLMLRRGLWERSGVTKHLGGSEDAGSLRLHRFRLEI